MDYFIAKTVDCSFDQAIERTTAALKKEGFGVLTEIDVKATLKKKLDVDFRRYQILGACNPTFAYKTLQAETWLGLMLPCNVVVQELPEGGVGVGVINPLVAMQGVNNADLAPVAQEVTAKLERALDTI